MSIRSPLPPQDMGVAASELPEVELEVDALAAGGRGVARREGRVWFVAGAVPGDRVRARVERTRPRWAEARVTELLRPSASRREPPCPHQRACGGCPWMVLPETEQRRSKRQIVVDALERIAGMDGSVVEPVRAAGPDLGYRDRVEFAVRLAAGRAVVGLHAADPAAGLVEVDSCRLQHAEAGGALRAARVELAAAAARAPAARVRARMGVRRGPDGSLVVVFREERDAIPGLGRVARALARRPEIAGVVRVAGLPGRRGGATARVLAGTGRLAMRIGTLAFDVPATAFTQVGPGGATALVEQILAEAAPDLAGAGVLDLYGGVGAAGLHLARGGAAGVVVCEADAEAVACGREAARRAGLAEAVRWVVGDVGAFLARDAAVREARVLVANPPRGGFGAGVADRLAAAPARRAIVVSCDPATLARDLRVLVRGGFVVRRVVPFDLFPQTAHVETIVTLVRP